jgi:hypothetical protein
LEPELAVRAAAARAEGQAAARDSRVCFPRRLCTDNPRPAHRRRHFADDVGGRGADLRRLRHLHHHSGRHRGNVRTTSAQLVAVNAGQAGGGGGGGLCFPSFISGVIRKEEEHALDLLALTTAISKTTPTPSNHEHERPRLRARDPAQERAEWRVQADRGVFERGTRPLRRIALESHRSRFVVRPVSLHGSVPAHDPM